jgi:WD40 repeat protein
MRIFNANSYAQERDFESDAPWNRIESNETGEQLVSVTKKTVEIRNLASGAVTATHRSEPNEEIGAAHWLHGSRQLVVYSSSRVILLDAASGQVAHTVESSGQDRWLFSYATRTLCDGRYFAGSGSQRSPRIYDSASGKLVSTLFGHTAHILNYACDPSRQYIATASTDGSARVWRIEDGKSIAVFSGQPGVVQDVIFVDDGKKIVTGGSDRALRVWSMEPEKRAASQIMRSLQCRTTWKIDGWDLQPTHSVPSACRIEP